MRSRVSGTKLRIAAASVVLACSISGSAWAQEPPDPNPGALTVIAGLDVPSVYVFRGITQEADPELTLFPYVDLGMALYSGDGAIKSVGVNVGVWNSLQTGSSGEDGPTGKLHYEEDFYTTLSLGFGGGFSLATTYTAYTSPNGMFNTVHDIAFKVSKSAWFSPYGVIIFELDGQADGGSHEGTYLELGATPAWPLAGGKLTFSVPVKLGLSVNDYYEGPDGDSAFGYFDIGALATIPLSSSTSKLGAWNIHGGVDLYLFGDTTQFFNGGDSSKWVGLIGFGLTY